MKTAKALREERAKLAAEIRRQADAGEATDGSGNYTEAWTKVNADYNALTRQIDIAETAERVDADQRERSDWRRDVGRDNFDGRRTNDGGETATEQQRTLALRAWLDSQMGESVTDESVEACRALRFNPRSGTLRMPMFNTADVRGLQSHFRGAHPSLAKNRMDAYRSNFADYRASLTIGSGSAGGYLVPPESLVRQLEVNMLYFGGMRQVAETIRTSTGERLSWPTADDTSNTGIQIGEGAAVAPAAGGAGQGTDPTFAKVFWDAYKFSSRAILVPYELIQDSAFNLAAVIGEMFGIRLGRVTNTKFTVGTGAATAMGLITKLVALGNDTTGAQYSKGYVKTAVASKLTYDDILVLEHSVDPAYRLDPTFMAHDQIFLALRQLKDGVGRPLWQSNVREGMPDTLDGKPLMINQDMDSTIATGKNVLTYGQHDAYKIRTVGEVRMYRLEERYRDTDQDGFIAMTREDGNLLTAGTAPVKLIQIT